MKHVLPLLFALSFSAFASRNQTIEIDCTPKDGCTPKSDSLSLQSQDRLQVTIRGADKWNWSCEISGVAKPDTDATRRDDCRIRTGNEKILHFKPSLKEPAQPTEIPLKEVSIPYKIEPPALRDNEKIALSILAMVSFVGTLASFALGYFILRSAGSHARELEQFESALRNVASQFQDQIFPINDALAFRQVNAASPARVDPQPRTESSPVDPRHSPRGPLSYAEFIPALDRWSELAGTMSHELRPSRDMIVNSGGQISLERFKLLVDDIVTDVVRMTDEFIDPRRRDGDLQDRLLQLMASAGLTAIFPGPGATFDQSVHHIIQKLPAQRLGDRQRIAAVVRRGLARKDKVLNKAEVAVYD